VPIFIRLVRAAIAAAMVSGAASTERVGAAWSSASHITSRPQRSAASTCSNDWSKAVVWLSPVVQGNSWNMPNSMGCILP
jgi:hypothetical protein